MNKMLDKKHLESLLSLTQFERCWEIIKSHLKCYAALAEKERELAELREKVRRWAVASEKLKTMVQNDYYVDDHTAAKHNMKEAEAVLRAAVEKKK